MSDIQIFVLSPIRRNKSRMGSLRDLGVAQPRQGLPAFGVGLKRHSTILNRARRPGTGFACPHKQPVCHPAARPTEILPADRDASVRAHRNRLPSRPVTPARWPPACLRPAARIRQLLRRRCGGIECLAVIAPGSGLPRRQADQTAAVRPARTGEKVPIRCPQGLKING